MTMQGIVGALANQMHLVFLIIQPDACKAVKDRVSHTVN
jgi:hypothetical protein